MAIKIMTQQETEAWLNGTMITTGKKPEPRRLTAVSFKEAVHLESSGNSLVVNSPLKQSKAGKSKTKLRR
jgi:hypothetical protein